MRDWGGSDRKVCSFTALTLPYIYFLIQPTIKYGSGIDKRLMQRSFVCIHIVCCIYHAPHPVGESSSESSSSDSESDDSVSGGSDGDDDDDDGKARMSGKGKGKRRKKFDGHVDGESGCEHDHSGDGGVNGKGPARAKRKSRNAYETVPHAHKGKAATEGKS